MASVQVVYNGPFDEVQCPALGLDLIIKGEPITVSEADAEWLCIQDVWSVVKPPAAPKPAPKPADQ